MINSNTSKEDTFMDMVDMYRENFYNDELEIEVKDPKGFLNIVVKLIEVR